MLFLSIFCSSSLPFFFFGDAEEGDGPNVFGFFEKPNHHQNSRAGVF
jgi:hypothetical protein